MINKITAAKYFWSRLPASKPFWDTIRATSPRVIMPMPTKKIGAKIIYEAMSVFHSIYSASRRLQNMIPAT